MDRWTEPPTIVPLVEQPSTEMHLSKKNKAGYTATLVACGWAGAMLEKVAERVKRGPTDGRTDRYSGV